MERIGLIPAAGFASRLGPLPCSKEIYPVGYGFSVNEGKIGSRVACHSLLEKMANADVKKIYIISRPQKLDILSYLGSGKNMGLNLAYLVVEQTSGVPFTLDCAFPFVKSALIFFGFPDIIFGPHDALKRLANRQRATDADIVLGLYRTERPQKSDMVKLDQRGKVLDIVIKPSSTNLVYTWIVAVWTAVFSRFLHTFIGNRSTFEKKGSEELYIGDVIREGLRAGLSVEKVIFCDGNYMDIGTPEDLIQVTRGIFDQGRGSGDD